MKRALLSLCLPFATAAQLPPPIVSVAPPAPHAVTLPTAQRTLLTWRPEGQCGGVPLDAAQFRQPAVAMAWGATTTLKPIDYLFTIAASGRTTDIRRESSDYVPFADDVAPALAATQFAAGAARACRVRFVPEQTPLLTAARADLIAYSLAPTMGALPREAQDVIHGAGSCFREQRPQPLLQAFPDFAKVDGSPGVRDWSMVGYDIDANGRPTGVRILYGTGNTALDAASLDAIRASRYAGGPRTGCQFPYWHAPAKLVAPPIPEEATFRPADATCPARRDWLTEPVLRFPEPYRRRAIEGWAVVAYDIAPWGEIGNIRVLASQPSDDFGKQAIQVMRAAKVAPAGQGAVGCVDRVKFVMGPVGGIYTNDSAPPPPF
ncbi:energy transducer TonB [Sphingomonas sp. PB4P5]|uniref:energy transducer TonB n=1 Tax=Parasphingomonas puruogangriensis TaxID=3096155 RepID=UPI002FC5D1E3